MFKFCSVIVCLVHTAPKAQRRSSAFANIPHFSPAVSDTITNAHVEGDLVRTATEVASINDKRFSVQSVQSSSPTHKSKHNKSASGSQHLPSRKSSVTSTPKERNYTGARHNPFDEEYYHDYLSRSLNCSRDNLVNRSGGDKSNRDTTASHGDTTRGTYVLYLNATINICVEYTLRIQFHRLLDIIFSLCQCRAL